MSEEKSCTLSTYHTNLRNVGLYSSISIALISFVDKGVLKNYYANKVLFILGIIFLIVSFILSKELKEYCKKNSEYISEKLILISKLIYYTILVFLTVIIYSVLHILRII